MGGYFFTLAVIFEAPKDELGAGEGATCFSDKCVRLANPRASFGVEQAEKCNSDIGHLTWSS